MNKLQGVTVLITGCGLKVKEQTYINKFTNKVSHMPLIYNNIEYKLNIGAACAYEAAQQGANIIMVGRSEQNLAILKNWIIQETGNPSIGYEIVDLYNAQEWRDFIKNISNTQPLYWVHSMGLGAGTVKIPHDNPYVPFLDVNLDLMKAEFEVVRATMSCTQDFLPYLLKQRHSKIVFVTSMSGVRTYKYGTIHCAGKGAMVMFVNALRKELDGTNISITDVRPGGVDTGMYDSELVRDTCNEIFGLYGNTKEMQLMSPQNVGESIVQVLQSDAHIPSINLLSQGQWPDEAS